MLQARLKYQNSKGELYDLVTQKNQEIKVGQKRTFEESTILKQSMPVLQPNQSLQPYIDNKSLNNANLVIENKLQKNHYPLMAI